MPATAAVVMTPLLRAALALNVGVLVPVIASLARDAPWTRAAYGPPSGARSILAAVYVSILVASVGLLAAVPSGAGAVALLSVQAVYKALTPLTTGGVGNVVVRWNIGIAAFQALAIARAVWV